jgi:hypothetical protein
VHDVNRRENIPVVKVTEVDLANTCVGVFFIIPVSEKIVAVVFLPRSPADRRGPQFQSHCHVLYSC